MNGNLARRVTAEGVGTALLVATVVGSGIMAERLANGNAAVALLANTIATGAGLIAFILAFGPISGAHFNPVVTVADAWQGGLRWKDVPPYLLAQLMGAAAGTVLAHIMFDMAAVTPSTHVRAGVGQLVSEAVATFGLLSVIWACARRRPNAAPFAVGAYISAAYWFTASTSFANPAVTFARTLTDSFSGIRPIDAPAFIGAQIVGAAAATMLFRWLLPLHPAIAREVVVPHLEAVKSTQ
jgi:glycerol uptake facilitator-like aquaporin